MKLEGRVDKKKKRATRRQKVAQLGQMLSVNDKDVLSTKRLKVSHDVSFICTPKRNEIPSLHTIGGLQIIPGSPELLQ